MPFWLYEESLVDADEGLRTEAVGFRRCRWQLPMAPQDPAALERLAHTTGLSRLLAGLLWNRSIVDPAQVNAFLHPRLTNLHPPETVPGVTTAAELVAAAVKKREKIAIYGDYDVDGITGAAMFWRLLKAAGADCTVHIPHRTLEGYGLSAVAVGRLADAGCRLLLTVDCGITGHQAVAEARRRGMRVVITDHHELPPTLPEAHAIAHPRLASSTFVLPPSSCPGHLCGAGVAYKLAWAVAVRLCGTPRLTQHYRDLLLDFLELAALATIADVVPLTGENRVLAHFGLAALPRSRLPGVQALIAAAGWENRRIDGTAVGFSLAPRLNAAGRMDHAREALELLITDDPVVARRIAATLERQNAQRRTMQLQHTAAAVERIRALAPAGTPEPDALVLCDAAWHGGVVGIVAARIVELFHRPAFILTTDGKTAFGSGRSVPGLPLHEAIAYCRDLLLEGGGHAAAGGVRLVLENLESFRARLCAWTRQRYHAAASTGAGGAAVLPGRSAGGFVPVLELDGVLHESDISLPTFIQLEQLAPFGHGNPRPKFLLSQARLQAPPRRVGATGDHLQLQLGLSTCGVRAIGFRMGQLEPELPAGLAVDLVVEPHVNRFNNRAQIEMHVLDLARSDRLPLRSWSEYPNNS